MPKPDSRTSARFKPAPCPLESTSIQTARLTQILPNSAARMSSVLACGMPRSISIKMLLSKVKLLNGVCALLFVLNAQFAGCRENCRLKRSHRLAHVDALPARPCATHAPGHPLDRKGQEIQRALQGNQNPKASWPRLARVFAIQLHRQCRRDLSMPRTLGRSSQAAVRVDRQPPLHARPAPVTCLARPQAGQAI